MAPSYVSQRGQLIRSFYAEIGKSGIIVPAAFLVAVGLGLVTLGLVFYARDVFHASPRAIGLLAGTWSLPYVLGCLFVRPLFGRVLPRYLIAGSTFCVFLSVFVLRSAPRITWLYLPYALYGMSLSMFWPPLMGWLSADLEGKELGRAVNRFNASWCTGNLISPFLCGWLSEKDPVFPLVLACVLFLVTGLFVLVAGLALPRIRADRAPQSAPSNDTAAGGECESMHRYPAWVGLFTCFFALGTLSAVFPVHARESLGFSKSMIGGLFFARGLLNVAGFVVLGKTQFWHFKTRPMLAGQLLAGFLFLCLAGGATTLPQVAVLLAGVGLASAMAYSASIFHGASGSRNRARRMAIHESVLASGVMAGSVCGGMVFQAFSARYAYGLCALVLLASVLVQALLCRRC